MGMIENSYDALAAHFNREAAGEIEAVKGVGFLDSLRKPERQDLEKITEVSHDRDG